MQTSLMSESIGDTKCIEHMLDFQEHGVTKKWVLLSEISKEVENNICMCFIATRKILGFYISVVHSFQAKRPKRGVII